MKRREFAINSVAAASLASLPFAALAQKRKDAVVMGMTLEPPGLDPIAGAAFSLLDPNAVERALARHASAAPASHSNKPMKPVSESTSSTS